MKRFFTLVFGVLLAFVVTAVAVGYPPATLTSTDNSITVGSLDCGTNYQIRVWERNNGVWTNANTYTKSTLACPTPTPTPSPTPTPTPTATPTPTPTPTPPPSTDFPDASNTGVPAGTTLTAYTGPSNVTTAGTVIDGKSIGCIQISALNVTIRNSRVSCSGGYAVYVDDQAGKGSVTVEDSEVTCNNSNGTGLGEARITVRRSEIYGCENGFDMNQAIDVRDSFIYNLFNGNGAHADGAQMASAHWAGSWVPGSKDITFVHNTIFSVDSSGALGTSAIISNHSADIDHDVLIQGNLMGGGAVALYCVQGATGVNYRVLDNAFTKRFSPNVGAYGISTDCSDEVQSGNYIQETGAQVNLP